MIDMKGMCTFCLGVADANIINSDESLVKLEDCWSHFQTEEWSGSSTPSFLNKGKPTKIPPMCKSCILPATKVGKCHEEITELEKKLEVLWEQLDEAVTVIRRIIGQAKDKNDSVMFKFSDETTKFLRTLISETNNVNSSGDVDVDDNDNPKPKMLLPESSILYSTSIKEESFPDTPNTEFEAQEYEEEFEEKVKCEDIGSDKSDHDGDSNYETIDTDSESQLETAEPSPKRQKLSPAPNDPIDRTKPKSNKFADVIKAMRSGCRIGDLNKMFQLNDNPKEKSQRKMTDPSMLPSGSEKPYNSFSCPICKERLTLETNYEHMRAHVGDLVFQCPGCALAFPSRYSSTYAETHYCPKYTGKCKVAPPSPPRKIVCEVCEKDVTTCRKERHFDKHETLEKNFTCPLPTCDEAFTHKQTLEYHIRIHEARYQSNKKSKERRGMSKYFNFPCRFCGEPLRLSSSLMMEHMRNHVGEYAYECPSKKCGHVFPSRYSMEFWGGEHRQKCDLPLPPIHCDTCGDDISKGGCSRVMLLEKHLRHHESQEKNFDCPVTSCGERFTTKQSVEVHLRTHELCAKKKKEMQICSLCEAGSLRRRMAPTDLETHLKKAHQVNDIVKCKVPDCPFVFPNQEELLQHKISYHMKSKAAKCDLCDCSESFYVTKLKLHYLNEHQVGAKVECEYCNKVMTNSEALRNHIYKIHKNKSRYKCDVSECGRAFASTWDLKSHNIIVHGGEPLNCKLCPATFNGRIQLWNHEKFEHLGLEKPTFPCPKCSIILGTKMSLKCHLENVHRDPSTPEFKCPKCDKMFKSELGRARHVRNIHEQDPSLHRLCDLCGKTLKGPKELIGHMLIHTGERPYVCALCGKRFRQLSQIF